MSISIVQPQPVKASLAMPTKWWETKTTHVVFNPRETGFYYGWLSSQLNTYYNQGFRVIEIFAPILGNANEFGGLGVMDFYQLEPTADSSGNGNTATNVSCPWWMYWRSGTTLTFDGSSQYVNVGDPSSLNFSGQITVGAWVWVDTANQESVIIGKGWVGSNTPWWLSLTNGTTARFGTYQNGAFTCDGSGSSLINNGISEVQIVFYLCREKDFLICVIS